MVFVINEDHLSAQLYILCIILIYFNYLNFRVFQILLLERDKEESLKYQS